MNRNFLIVLMTVLSATSVYAAEGMLNIQSDFNVEQTANRLENILKEKEIIVFNRIKHSDGAGKVGIELRDTELIIFGNPKIGSPLMKCQQSAAIDLPLKALIWEDANARTWVSYNDPRYMEKRHNITGCEEVIMKIEKALSGIMKAASTK